MGVEELRRVLSGYHLLALDTMVFSYHLSNHPHYAPLASAVLETIESGQAEGLTTTITLAEILAVPAKAANRQAMLEYELYLTNFPNLRLMPLDTALAREAAWVRATTGLRVPDAIQIAAARMAGADAVVGNDRRWVGRISEPALIMLDDFATGG